MITRFCNSVHRKTFRGLNMPDLFNKVVFLYTPGPLSAHLLFFFRSLHRISTCTVSSQALHMSREQNINLYVCQVNPAFMSRMNTGECQTWEQEFSVLESIVFKAEDSVQVTDAVSVLFLKFFLHYTSSGFQCWLFTVSVWGRTLQQTNHGVI